jgi:hypothetical protein
MKETLAAAKAAMPWTMRLRSRRMARRAKEHCARG